MLTVAPHPLLEHAAFTTTFPEPLERVTTPTAIVEWMRADAATSLAPNDPRRFTVDDAVRKAVRDLLRRGGYKPTGRGKPASEYLAGVAAEGPLTTINAAVDACNVVSLHSGLPISVVDLDRTRGALSIRTVDAGASYVFNASGQTIDLGGLLCLCDEDGPCANAVKDAQRTKTHAETRRTLSIVWGTNALPGRAAQAMRWYRALLESAGATTQSA